jgi:hypothetical protein
MTIIETPIFTRRVLEILSDDEYRELQRIVAENPEVGAIIPGSKGLRKLRWTFSGKGKRGGTRIIYYWVKSRFIVLMLFLFKKNERSDITKEQITMLRNLVNKELR